MRTYIVNRPGEIAGRWREDGAEIALSREQARYLAPPLGDIVRTKDPQGHGTIDRRGRRKRRTTL